MPVYRNAEQLYDVLKLLFGRVHALDPEAAYAVSKSRLIVRLRLASPTAEVVINARKNPPEITYGNSSLRPDLDVDLTADALHHILLAELPLRKAIASKQMKVRGPVWKSFVLEGIFRSGQTLYPQILSEIGLNDP
jgi:hypothetical protein